MEILPITDGHFYNINNATYESYHIPYYSKKQVYQMCISKFNNITFGWNVYQRNNTLYK